jgi:hypothetical protein
MAAAIFAGEPQTLPIFSQPTHLPSGPRWGRAPLDQAQFRASGRRKRVYGTFTGRAIGIPEPRRQNCLSTIFSISAIFPRFHDCALLNRPNARNAALHSRID